MQTPGKQISRTIAIGDIHGCSAALSALLCAINPQPSDTIITLGDYVNRGPDTKGAIEQLIDLASRCKLIPLMGNHDQTLLDVVDGHVRLDQLLAMGGDTTLASYGAHETLAAMPSTHVDFLRSCRLYFEMDTHFFVHANYSPNQQLNQTDAVTLLWRSLRDYMPSPHFSGRIAVLGHTPQADGRPLNLGHLICLDTGCVYGQMLTALELNTEQTWQINAA